SDLDEEFIDGNYDSLLFSDYVELSNFTDFNFVYNSRLKTDSTNTAEKEKTDVKIKKHIISQIKLNDKNKILSLKNDSLYNEVLQLEFISDNLKDSLNEALNLVANLHNEQAEMLNMIEFENGSNKVYYLGKKTGGKANGYGVAMWSTGGFY